MALLCAIFAQDFTVARGSLGFDCILRKITRSWITLLKMRMPLIGINDSGRCQDTEGVNSLAGYGENFLPQYHTRAV